MEKLFNELIEAAKKNKKGLLRLKNALVTLQQFELAVKIREIETASFPETEEIKQAKKYASGLKLAFSMVGLNTSDDTCWLISETLKIYDEKKGKFSLDDATTLKFKKDEIFDTE